MYMQQEESIYNIIPPEEVKAVKPPMHRSKHSGQIPPTASTFGQAQTSHPLLTNIAGDAGKQVVPKKLNRTMGLAPGSAKPAPDSFLKKCEKREHVSSLAEVKKDRPELLQPTVLKPRSKPGVPPRDDKPIMNLVTSKNFVVANAVETILAAPKKVSVGAKDYLHKEDYGKVPKYLQHIKEDISAEYDYIRMLQEQEEEARSAQVRPLTEDERQAMVDGLKAKWEQVNTDYQATTHITKLDTIGLVRRKEKWEAELQQIEKDIEKLNRKNILVDATS